MSNSTSPFRFNLSWQQILLIILPTLLFLERYYTYFVLRLKAMNGTDSSITFKSFFIFNFALGVMVMWATILTRFAVLKVTSVLWKDIPARQLLKAASLSYIVYFIAALVKIGYFEFFASSYGMHELRDFDQIFYLEQRQDLELNVISLIGSQIYVLDVIYYMLLFLILDLRVNDVSTLFIALISLIGYICVLCYKLLLVIIQLI